jgi:hypothetical protein
VAAVASYGSSAQDLLRRKALDELGIFDASGSIKLYLQRLDKLVEPYQVDVALYLSVLRALMPEKGVTALAAVVTFEEAQGAVSQLFHRPHDVSSRMSAVVNLRQMTTVIVIMPLPSSSWMRVMLMLACFHQWSRWCFSALVWSQAY